MRLRPHEPYEEVGVGGVVDTTDLEITQRRVGQHDLSLVVTIELFYDIRET